MVVLAYLGLDIRRVNSYVELNSRDHIDRRTTKALNPPINQTVIDTLHHLQWCELICVVGFYARKHAALIYEVSCRRGVTFARALKP